MKLKIFERIVERIQKEATCPKCKGHFELDSIDIINLDRDLINFGIFCKKCQGEIVISGQVHTEKVSIPNPASRAESSQKASPIRIKDLTKILKNFTEKDIVKLFEKDQNKDK